MSDAKPTDEPSIEEILGSIRRIIADDETADDMPSAALSPSQPSLAAADPVQDDHHLPPDPFAAGTDASAAMMASQMSDDAMTGDYGDEDDEAPLELTQKLDDDGTVIDMQQHPADQPVNVSDLSFSAPMHDNQPDEDAMVDFTETTTMADTLVSHGAADATAAVFAKLARNTALNRSGHDGVTLEDMVKDMLRPMLREWLDHNLPEMVQAMVERELEKISRRVG